MTYELLLAAYCQRILNAGDPTLKEMMRPGSLTNPVRMLRDGLQSGRLKMRNPDDFSAAIGEALPRDRSNLVINLINVEPPLDGRLVLVADAEAKQSDGSIVGLKGMRVRCTPRVSLEAGNLLVLDK